MIAQLRAAIPIEEFDYRLLLAALGNLQNPRQKITALLKNGHIVRIKKGLYVWGDAWRKRPVQKEILANLIYGPSIVSSDWALSEYGIIPEHVTIVTSTGPKPPKDFETPLGLFRYTHVPLQYHAHGMERKDVYGTGYLMASPERSLSDRLLEMPGLYRPTLHELETLLLEELRIDDDSLAQLNVSLIEALAEASQSPRIHQLHALLRARRINK